MTLDELSTPALLLDERRLLENIEQMTRQADRMGVALRPHMKTAKSIQVFQRLGRHGSPVPVTVSTLREAEVFAEAGCQDIIYAVGIAPRKLERVIALRQRGCDLKVVLDSVAQAEAVAQASREARTVLPALIEIDSDQSRAGVSPDDPQILRIGRTLQEGGAALAGVLTHAGGSYAAMTHDERAAFAERERKSATTVASVLLAEGLPCPIVSVGATPTALSAQDLSGVTEMRPGVFLFFDLVMAGIGVCTIDQIAISTLATVIGHQIDRGWALIDAGWTALSTDRGTASQAVDQGYGLVCDLDGRVMTDLIVRQVNQEHGIVAHRSGDPRAMPHLPVGTRIRVLPNHACAMAERFDGYHAILADSAGLEFWPRFRGW